MSDGPKMTMPKLVAVALDRARRKQEEQAQRDHLAREQREELARLRARVAELERADRYLAGWRDGRDDAMAACRRVAQECAESARSGGDALMYSGDPAAVADLCYRRIDALLERRRALPEPKS